MHHKAVGLKKNCDFFIYFQLHYTSECHSGLNCHFFGACILLIVHVLHNTVTDVVIIETCIHSYATQLFPKWLRIAFSTMMHPSHLNLKAPFIVCHVPFLFSRVCNPWNEQNGSENERITIKLHPNSADCLISICGDNFKPSKSMSSLYCTVLH